MKHYGVRELSRVTKADTKTVMKYLKELVLQKVVVKHKETRKYPFYEANRQSYTYKHEKSEFLVKQIIRSGLIEFLEKNISPKAIVLFGSVQKGTYHSESDIDLFINANYRHLNLRNFEKKIGHSIQLLFESDLHNFNTGLLTNIYNGFVLSGKLEVL